MGHFWKLILPQIRRTRRTVAFNAAQRGRVEVFESERNTKVPFFSLAFFCGWQESQQWHFCIYFAGKLALETITGFLFKTAPFFKYRGLLSPLLAKSESWETFNQASSVLSSAQWLFAVKAFSSFLLFPLHLLVFCPWHWLSPEECLKSFWKMKPCSLKIQ